MKSVELKFGRLHLKLMKDKVLLFAATKAGKERGLHFTQYFEPLNGRLTPHLTELGGQCRKFLGSFRPKRFTQVMLEFQQELTDQFIKVARRVEPDVLEEEGWFILCPEVTRKEFSARFHKDPDTLSLTEETLKGIEELPGKAARPAGMLNQLTDETQPIGAFRSTAAGDGHESAFLYYYPDGLNDAPGWYLVPQSLFSPEQYEEWFLRHVHPAVWRMMCHINDRLGLDGDREKMLRFARGER